MTPQEMDKLRQEALAELGSAGTADAVESVRIKYLGRKGILQGVMKGLRDVAAEHRSAVGQGANQLKNDLVAGIKQRLHDIESAGAPKRTSAFDYSLPGTWRGYGVKHPISQVMEESAAIFAYLGFTMADGPDIETEYHNFDALNTPADHPSRDIQDTYWFDNGLLLRTQTSPVQIRVMENNRPPVRVIAPGRCYRRDRVDATHSAVFHQIEGLYVDRKVSMADLKSDITFFARRLIGQDVQVRFRPHFFPFTEPSVEYDFSCHMCAGKGCRVCKNSGWIEISGAGMVNPRVFEAVGYDPETVTGYAFGMGVERIAMIRYGISDIRNLYENDTRYLAQFR